MDTVHVASENYLASRAAEILMCYYRKSPWIVPIYDRGWGEETLSGTITLSDIARICALAAQLKDEHVGILMFAGVDPAERLCWEAIAKGSSLALANDTVFKGMQTLWESPERPYTKSARISKLLHLKYPDLYPVLDSRVLMAYIHREEPRRGDILKCWKVVQQDLHASVVGLERTKTLLRENGTVEGTQLAELTDVRILDILAWQREDDRRREVK